MRESIIIIGSGPATYVAAIYAATANLKPLVLLQPPNQTITGLDSIPGIPQIIDSSEYISLLRKQAERFDVRFLESKVVDIHCDTINRVTTKDKTYLAMAVILDDIEFCKEVFLEDNFEENKVKCEEKSTKSTIRGVFVCGSAKEKRNDAVVLCGSGCMAAMDAKEYIENQF